MADISRPLPPQRRGSEMNPVQNSDEDSLAHLEAPPSKLRQRRAIPRIASLDVLSAAKMAGSTCPSIRSVGSHSSCHQLSPSPVEPTEVVWYQDRDQTKAPMSLDQMVDALHHIMMTKSVLDPVPREYNSYILHLLEGYWSVQAQLKKTGQTLKEEMETSQRSINEFTKMSDEWQEKEAAFRAEIKRMELVLAKVAPEGVGAVVLARSESVVDRSATSSRMFKAKIEKARGSPEKSWILRESQQTLEPHARPIELSMQPNLDDNADVELSQELRKVQRRRHRTIKHDRKNMPLDPAAIVRALDTSSSEEDNKLSPSQGANSLSVRPQAVQLPLAAPSMQDTGASQFATNKPEYGSLRQSPGSVYRGTPGVNPSGTGAIAAANTADERSPVARPNITASAIGKPPEDPAWRASQTHQHKREFSFEAGKDGIQLQSFGNVPDTAKERSAFGCHIEPSVIRQTPSPESRNLLLSSRTHSSARQCQMPHGDTQAGPHSSERRHLSTYGAENVSGEVGKLGSGSRVRNQDCSSRTQSVYREYSNGTNNLPHDEFGDRGRLVERRATGTSHPQIAAYEALRRADSDGRESGEPVL
ncbi:hypothetical protein CTA1_3281 [Colletotrichum tanaceti]|uniref:Uncharacterized protein n=1 Tax=Colletotrichum tanaceti TaxID=1306861 RepID=A0A4U6X1Y4_9PEZI|nr:hypothetical protein CTA1_3281 [Colletotrichum tanaceti]